MEGDPNLEIGGGGRIKKNAKQKMSVFYTNTEIKQIYVLC